MGLAMKHAALLLSALMAAVEAQYLAQYGQQPAEALFYKPEQQQQQQHAAILSHRQGQSSDGAVNYNFATDHGLQQGETINPDGSRSGSYSYLDPNGKKISVKYSAGKDGFRILEGDHVPKPVAPLAAPQQTLAPQQAPRYSVEPAYSKQTPALYSGAQQDYRAGQASPYLGLQGSRHSPYYSVQEQEDSDRFYASPHQAAPSSAPRNYAAVDDAEPRKPHNFGPGYAFQIEG
ncbi:uncharacterized protein LOC134531462 [Bacillus rossius redtenbacheri]|uniref:uncharacterized protein LOC134531462 n=1 Tax=Bacillus rossius redtenbacheri TaxID=93214 RepID=UPI002FDE99EC